jgi:hypothetical protein
MVYGFDFPGAIESFRGFVAKFREQTTQVTTTRLGVNSD